MVFIDTGVGGSEGSQMAENKGKKSVEQLHAQQDGNCDDVLKRNCR